MGPIRITFVAVAGGLALAGCAYGTIKNVPEEMIAEPEDDRDLVAAILAGEMESADHMIATGANIDQVAAGGTTPLIAAAQTGANGIAARLLEMGADSAAKDDAGNNALAIALQHDNEALVTLLVEHARASY